MAWFGNWFSKKNSGNEGFPPESVFFEQMEPAKSHVSGSRRTAAAEASKRPSGSPVSERKNLRLEQRELLYGVVRETMARLGLPMASYKYKVLSLDPQGREYLIMMDLTHEVASPAHLMSQIEPTITRDAKSRHNILVSAIYWRFNENQVTDDAEANQAVAKAKIDEAKAAKKALNKEFSKSRHHPVAAPSGFPDTLLVDPDEGASTAGVRPTGRSK